MADQTSPPSGTPSYADAGRRYRLDSPIAAGGMGEVWRATDTVLDRLVAVKLLRQEHADDPVFRARFETEAQHAAGLHHPGVAQVYDFGAGDDQHPPYLVMEHVAGKPLSAILRPGQPMDPAAAANLIALTGEALGAAHARGVVHRDVKPANILVTDDRQVKITDFGIARAADAVALTRTGEVLGTPQYISPEQAEGRQATPASDVYSLGAVAYECLAGRRPFEADSPVATAIAHLRQPVPELPSAVPPALAAVVRRAMAKAPEDRYPDGATFAAAIREADVPASDDPAATKVLAAPLVGAGAAAGAVAAGTTVAAASSGRRRVPMPVWAAAGVLVLVVAVAALAALTTGGDDSSPGTDTTPPPTTPSSASVPSSPVTSSESSSVSSPTTSASSQDEGDDQGDGNQGNGNDLGNGHGHGHGNGHDNGKGHQ